MTDGVIDLQPYKLPEFPHLGFTWADIIRPKGCNTCGWYGLKANFHPIDGEFECPKCSSRAIKYFPGIAPDMLQ